MSCPDERPPAPKKAHGRGSLASAAPLVCAAAVLGFAVWLWGPMLSYYFVLEDGTYLRDAVHPDGPAGPGALNLFAAGGRIRPLMPAVFRLMFRLFDFDPLPYHVLSLGLLLCCVLVLGAWIRDRERNPFFACVAMALVAWHPLHWPWVGVGIYGVQYFTLLGLLLVLWFGHRALTDGTRRDAWCAAGAFVLGVGTMEYAFSGVVALAGLALLRRNWRGARRLSPLWILALVYVGISIALFLHDTPDRYEGRDALLRMVYRSDAPRVLRYIPKSALYFLLALPGANLWTVYGDRMTYAVGWRYAAGTTLVLAFAIRQRLRWGSEVPVRTDLFDLGLLQSLAALGVACLAPGFLVVRAMHMGLGMCLVMLALLRPVVQRPIGLLVVLSLYAANSVWTVTAFQNGRCSILPLVSLQARNAVQVPAYRELFVQHPEVDAVYVHGYPVMEKDFRIDFLISATPRDVQWIVNPLSPEPFRRALVCMMTGPQTLGPIAIVDSPGQLARLASSVPVEFGADGW